MMSLEELVKKFISDAGPMVGATGVDVPDDIEVNVQYYEDTGWAHHTPTGAPRSKLVDELRKELYDKGFNVIADQIPKYHCIAFWLKQPFPETAFVNIDKVKSALADFGSFAPIVEDEDEDNLVDNIVWQTKSVLGTIINTNRDYPKVEYRGQWNRTGFVKVVWDGNGASPDFSPSPIPNYKDLVATSAIQRPGAYEFSQFERKYDTFGFNARPIPGTGRQDHYVYNIWWSGVTDQDVGRFWRNWAVAVGAKIPVELD